MRKLKIWIVGGRGIPGLQGGVERRIENLAPRIVSYSNGFFHITVVNRSCYFKDNRIYNWQGVNIIYIFTFKNKYLEAALHTFFSIILAKINSVKLLHIQAIGPAMFTPLAKFLGLKVVITHHGPDYLREKWKGLAKVILKLSEFFAIKFADKIIVVSEYLKGFLEKKYNRKDLIVVRNGVDIPQIVPPGGVLKKFGLEPKKYIFTACRFVPEKGIDDLINAYRNIENPNFKLVIAGDADHETAYSRNVKKMANETKGVVLTGVVKGKELQELYSNAGLFVLPSYYEGLPIALLEALSYGLPVLVSDIPQHKEIPLPEDRYFPVGNVEKLSEKIVEMYNKGISEKEKEFILDYIKKNHDWNTAAQKVLAVYKQVIGYK